MDDKNPVNGSPQPLNILTEYLGFEGREKLRQENRLKHQTKINKGKIGLKSFPEDSNDKSIDQSLNKKTKISKISVFDNLLNSEINSKKLAVADKSLQYKTGVSEKRNVPNRSFNDYNIFKKTTAVDNTNSRAKPSKQNSENDQPKIFEKVERWKDPKSNKYQMKIDHVQQKMNESKHIDGQCYKRNLNSMINTCSNESNSKQHTNGNIKSMFNAYMNNGAKTSRQLQNTKKSEKMDQISKLADIKKTTYFQINKRDNSIHKDNKGGLHTDRHREMLRSECYKKEHDFQKFEKESEIIQSQPQSSQVAANQNTQNQAELDYQDCKKSGYMINTFSFTDRQYDQIAAIHSSSIYENSGDSCIKGHFPKQINDLSNQQIKIDKKSQKCQMDESPSKLLLNRSVELIGLLDKQRQINQQHINGNSKTIAGEKNKTTREYHASKNNIKNYNIMNILNSGYKQKGVSFNSKNPNSPRPFKSNYRNQTPTRYSNKRSDQLKYQLGIDNSVHINTKAKNEKLKKVYNELYNDITKFANFEVKPQRIVRVTKHPPSNVKKVSSVIDSNYHPSDHILSINSLYPKNDEKEHVSISFMNMNLNQNYDNDNIYVQNSQKSLLGKVEVCNKLSEREYTAGPIQCKILKKKKLLKKITDNIENPHNSNSGNGRPWNRYYGDCDTKKKKGGKQIDKNDINKSIDELRNSIMSCKGWSVDLSQSRFDESNEMFCAL